MRPAISRKLLLSWIVLGHSLFAAMNARTLTGSSASLLALLLAAACSGTGGGPSPVTGSAAGATSATSAAGAGSSGAPSSGSSGSAGAGQTTGGAPGQAGGPSQGGDSAGAAGSAPAGAGAAGAAGAGTAGAGGSSGIGVDQPPTKALTVDPTCKCALSFSAIDADPTAGKSPTDTHAGDAQSLYVNTTLKMQGKLVIVIGGIGNGPGGGGIEGFAKLHGFHVFAVATQTAISSAPDQYKTALKANPMDPEANRQVGDGRMEAWDGKDRVSWLTILPPDSVVNRTQAALKYAMIHAPGGGWDYYLNADGTVRWSDVFMVGYSFGSQTIAMDSKYVRFGRVFLTSGPQDEGFPNATWISQPSATPVERLYMAVGLTMPYPSTASQDSEVMGMFKTVTDAGWIGMPIVNVVPGGTGPFTGAHLLSMVGMDGNSPGGHTVFCNDNTKNGWVPACSYAFDVQ